MDYNINFPNLHIYLEHVGKNIMIGNFSIAYYGIIIACGMLAGIALICELAKRNGQNTDDYFDMSLITIVCSVICARIYYIIFRWDMYKGDLLSMINIRQGGLAIYGGVLGGIVTIFIFSKIRKLNYGLMMDITAPGLLVGQIMGRWGNFCNREAFGGYTNNLLAMQLPISAVRQEEITAEQWANTVILNGIEYIQVHPTFLYESLWNVGVLIILLLLFKHRKFNGEGFLRYLLGYGIGRFWIEGLRTDQLLLPVINYPVSRALAAVMAVVAMVWIFLGRRKAVAADKKE